MRPASPPERSLSPSAVPAGRVVPPRCDRRVLWALMAAWVALAGAGPSRRAAAQERADARESASRAQDASSDPVAATGAEASGDVESPQEPAGRDEAVNPCLRAVDAAGVRACEGLALAAAGRWVRAEQAIESAFQLGGPVVDALRPRLESALERARRELGSLEVRTIPEGARVSVDGEVVGTTPFSRPLRLAPGEHHVRATLAGHAPAELVARIAATALETIELRLGAHDTRPVLERVGAPGEAQRIVGVAAMVLGAVSLAVGVGTLVGGLEGMPSDRAALLDVARGTLIAGGVLTAAGLVLALTA